ncbi:hypothetical protein AFM11_30120 [Mycolicibacterium wolinskyi]|uniref:Uncharacterized protein n=2 Tax=Mycolicibacterium wolinskyi TaxID=59750 RepID=A0A132PDN8_9MYCO|nr:hypothetical protein AFM11_30120 [Mycolicibacterium wolinskyi]
MLRDDILAQLRTAGRPLTTSELRGNAPAQPLTPGAAEHYPPLQERVYRALLKLHADGKVVKHRARGRAVTWSAAASADDDEIDRLEDAFKAPPSAHAIQVLLERKGHPS